MSPKNPDPHAALAHVEVPAYDAPLLGEKVAVVHATLFSGAVDTDAGVIEFGGG